MAVTKISIALDPEVAAAASEAARGHDQSLSAWLNEAARGRLALERGRAAVSAWQAEHGELSDEERAAADATLDRLLRRPGEQ